ncbi:MAG TPA: type II toxin-antitoxin system VapC family toxin [Acidimicrobiales bacterium]
MIVYLDTSTLARAYLPDEMDRASAVALLVSTDHELVTGGWTRVELASALARARKGGRFKGPDIERRLLGDLGPDGIVTVLGWHQDLLEDRSIELVRRFKIRSLDALHLAYAELAALPVVPDGEKLGFATHDRDQGAAARKLGFVLV